MNNASPSTSGVHDNKAPQLSITERVVLTYSNKEQLATSSPPEPETHSDGSDDDLLKVGD